jgi:hypothetical protein
MKPIDVVAKAISDAFDGRPGWNEKCARAAILALADHVGAFELSDEIIDDADTEYYQPASTPMKKLPRAFESMLRAIADNRS